MGILLWISEDTNPLLQKFEYNYAWGHQPFNLPGSNLLPSSNLDFCEAPTSRAPTLFSTRLQTCLYEDPTLSMGTRFNLIFLSIPIL